MALNIDQYTARMNAYGYGVKDGYVDHEKEIIKSNFLDHPNYQSVTIDSVARNVHIITESSLTSNPEINKMVAYPDETFDNGQYVVWNGITWITLNDFANDDIQKAIAIQRCRTSLKWKDANNNTYEYPASHKIMSESSHGESSQKIIYTSEGEIRLYVQKNADTETIYNGQRFILGNNTYSVGLVENVEFPNVLTVFLRYDESNKDTDDFTNNIADNESPSFHI